MVKVVKGPVGPVGAKVSNGDTGQRLAFFLKKVFVAKTGRVPEKATQNDGHLCQDINAFTSGNPIWR